MRIIVLLLLMLLTACSSPNTKTDESSLPKDGTKEVLSIENEDHSNENLQENGTILEGSKNIQNRENELSGKWYVVKEDGNKYIMEISEYNGNEFTGYWDDVPLKGNIEGSNVFINILYYKDYMGLRESIDGWNFKDSTKDRLANFLSNDENIYSILEFEITETVEVYNGTYKSWTVEGVHGDNGDYLESKHMEGTKIKVTRNDQSDIYLGSGKVHFDDGNIKYIGEIRDGEPNGEGFLYNNDGSILASGIFEGGNLNCQEGSKEIPQMYLDKGMYFWGCGTIFDNVGNPIYTGDFAENKMDGQGALYYSDGKGKYEGTFKNDQPDGEGSENYSNGSNRYSGEFEVGMYSGQGQAYYPNGDLRYIGEWGEDQANGWGQVYINNDLVYEGDFVNGISHEYEITRSNPHTVYINGEKTYDISKHINLHLDEDKVIDLVLDVMPQTKAIKAFMKFVELSEVIE